MDLSVVIVTYNSSAVLPACLESLLIGLEFLREDGKISEVYLVDNCSSDDTRTLLDTFKRSNPQTDIHLILNPDNRGYARANNQAIEKSEGKYVLLLNPDTTIEEQTLTTILKEMDSRPDIGIGGVRLLKPDGSLDPACRRRFPTPGVSFFFFLNKIFRVDRIFPDNRRFQQYNLTFLDPEGQYEVDAVVGAFMVIRREMIRQNGLLDERFFMYGEDLDYCLRARQADVKVYYFGRITANHLKSAAAKTPDRRHYRSRRTLRAFYYSMFLFYNKHYVGIYSPFTTVFVYAGILFGFMFEIIRSWLVFERS